jgi:capsular exopolysaccharide synthesis family protein
VITQLLDTGEIAPTTPRAERAQAERPGAERRLSLSDEVRLCYAPLLQVLSQTGSDTGPRLLGVTSCRSGEGASTVAAHLAMAAATGGERRVLLVDAHFSRPCVPRIFAVRGRPGLAEAIEEGRRWAELLQSSGDPRLSLLVAGRPSGNASRVYEAAALPGMLEELSADFDLVVVDLPALASYAAALRLGALLDGIVLVVEAERVHRDVARNAVRQLQQGGAHPVGVVLNKWRQHVPDWFYRIASQLRM